MSYNFKEIENNTHKKYDGIHWIKGQNKNYELTLWIDSAAACQNKKISENNVSIMIKPKQNICVSFDPISENIFFTGQMFFRKKDINEITEQMNAAADSIRPAREFISEYVEIDYDDPKHHPSFNRSIQITKK